MRATECPFVRGRSYRNYLLDIEYRLPEAGGMRCRLPTLAGISRLSISMRECRH
jgi:hypothetical protein